MNSIIQKLKNKHISLKKYTDWAILGHVTQNLELTSLTTSCEPIKESVFQVDKKEVHVGFWGSR